MRVELDATGQVLRLDDAVSAPLVQVRVDVAGPTVTQTHRIWLDLETAAVARVVRLGPRKVRARGPVPMDDDVLGRPVPP